MELYRHASMDIKRDICGDLDNYRNTEMEIDYKEKEIGIHYLVT